MEKLPMCRICLVENVRMYVVVNKDLHELYERLTDIPFVTEDRRPMLACFFCCTKLKQCHQFLKKCHKAEELFAQMMKEDYKPDPLINAEHSKFNNGFITSPIEHTSIVDDGQTESPVIKEELPTVSERLDDPIVPKEELQTIKLEFENVDNRYADIEDTPAHVAESDSEDDVPLMEIKIELEEEQGSIGPPDENNAKLDPRRTIPEDVVPIEQEKNDNKLKPSCVSKTIKKTKNSTSKQITEYKESFTETKHGVENSIDNTASTSFLNNSNTDDMKTSRNVCVKEKPFKCNICQRSFYQTHTLAIHTRIHTGEYPFKCGICQRGFNRKSHLTTHTCTGEDALKCDTSHSSSFKQKKTLTKHVRVHTVEKPFKCDICPRSFDIKSNLTRHIRIHTGDKPFKCDICPRSFDIKSNLTRHIRIHTGEKPLKCKLGQRSSNRANNLAVHTSLHTGKYPFKCNICQRGFNRKSHLTTHTCTGEDYV